MKTINKHNLFIIVIRRHKPYRMTFLKLKINYNFQVPTHSSKILFYSTRILYRYWFQNSFVLWCSVYNSSIILVSSVKYCSTPRAGYRTYIKSMPGLLSSGRTMVATAKLKNVCQCISFSKIQGRLKSTWSSSGIRPWFQTKFFFDLSNTFL